MEASKSATAGLGMIVLRELVLDSKSGQRVFIVTFEKNPLSSRKIRGSRMMIPWIYTEEALTFYPQIRILEEITLTMHKIV